MNVSGLTTGANTVTAGFDHTCAQITGGAIKCWGDNTYGQTGNDMPNPTPASIPSSTTTSSYNYSDSAHKHAVTSLSTGETYAYDANGNMTSRTESGTTYTQIFDAENRLVSVTVNGQVTQFIYDGDSRMVRKIQPDNSSTIYIAGVYEVNKNAAGTITGTTTYYPAAGAMRVNGVMYYTIKDQLNSASVALDASENAVGETRYYPFGEMRISSGSVFTDRLYTGQRQMAALGLYDYGARFYLPKLGRFISPDSIIPNSNNSQSWNRYSYVSNNPINLVDPTGHVPGVPCWVSNTFNCNPNTTPSPSSSSGGGNGRGSISKGGGKGGVDPVLKAVLDSAYNYLNSAHLGTSSSGCNTLILWNGNGSFCHQNIYESQPVCLDVFHCSPKQQEEYATRFQYPGQRVWDKVTGNGQLRHVMGGDFIANPELQTLSAVTVDINGSTITNSTVLGHIFHQGTIGRTLGSDGFITTRGQGVNTTWAVAWANQNLGPVAFRGMDFTMIAFTTMDQLSHGALENYVDQNH